MISRSTRVILKTITVIILCIFIGVSLSGDDGQKGKKNEEKTESSKKAKESKSSENGEDADQSNNLLITYDFATGKFTKPDNGQFVVKTGQNIVFTIINFNRLAFKATINGEQVSDKTNSSAPEQFSAFLPKKSVKEDTNRSGMIEAASVGEHNEPPIEKKRKAINMDEAITNLSSLKKLRDDLEDAVNMASTFPHFESLKNQVLGKFLGELPGDTNTVNSAVLSKVKDIIEESENTINKVQEEIKQHGEQGKKIIASLEELEKIKNDPDKIKTKLKEIEADKKILNSIGLTNENCREFFNKLSQLENLLKEIKDNNYIDQIKELLSNIRDENFSVSLTIPSVEGDSVKITATIEPVDK
ncbi:MAG TPA: hypothetical protein VK469_12800, partial [Candidatus Kapabacteria bacterium]|nr:hypothetical protein [Candidatus Kapabacteria bacterium]